MAKQPQNGGDDRPRLKDDPEYPSIVKAEREAKAASEVIRATDPPAPEPTPAKPKKPEPRPPESPAKKERYRIGYAGVTAEIEAESVTVALAKFASQHNTRTATMRTFPGLEAVIRVSDGTPTLAKCEQVSIERVD